MTNIEVRRCFVAKLGEDTDVHISRAVALRGQLKRSIITADYFSGPGSAIGPLCACSYNNNF